MFKRFALPTVLMLAAIAGFALASSDADKVPATPDTNKAPSPTQPVRDNRPHDFLVIRSTVLVEAADQEKAGGVLVAITPTDRVGAETVKSGEKLDAGDKVYRGVARN